MQEPSSTETFDVVVVGAGPVGLTAALLLGAQQLHTLLLERQPSPSSTPKAISLDDSSMRTYQRAGIDDRVASVIVPGTGTAYYDRDGQFLFHASGPGGAPQGHPFKNPFAQPDLEAVLESCVESSPTIDLRRGAEVVDVSSEPERAVVDYQLDGAARRVAARFVIGADGGQSTVRRRLDIGMDGQSFDEPWLVVDALEDHHDERFGMHHGNPHRPHVIVPGLRGRCRYEFKLSAEEGTAGHEPSFSLIRRLLKPYRDIEPHQIERAIVYRFHALVARAFQHGRVFLAGDAAHMMPPFAGQGLNSGVRDVANLSWKIADVCSGRLNPTTLASYELERRPHVEATVAQSVLLGANVMTSSWEVATERDRRVRKALSSHSWRGYLERMEYRPESVLSNGLVVMPSEGNHVGTKVEQPMGFCMTDHRVKRLDDLLGTGWSLIGVDVRDSAWTNAPDLVKGLEAQLVGVITKDRNPRSEPPVLDIVDFDGALTNSFGRHSGRFLLVRPDRVIAATWLPDMRHAAHAVRAIRQGAFANPSDGEQPQTTHKERCPLWVTHD